MMRVGVIGLGKMGSSIARNLLDRGVPLSVWNRTPSAASELKSAGATVCNDVESLVGSVDAVVVMLWGDEVATEISLGRVIPAARSGQLVIECSTLSPRMYEKLAASSAEHAVDFLACPVIGSVDAARNGSLVLLPGGTRAVFERAKELLEKMGSTITFTGAPGASGFLKLASNSILGVIADSIGELLRINDKAGVDRALTIETVLRAFERAPLKRSALLDRDTTARFSAGALLKDLHLATDARRSIGAEAPVLDCVTAGFEEAVGTGLADRDYISVSLALESVSR